jgi:hypothetical protein
MEDGSNKLGSSDMEATGSRGIGSGSDMNFIGQGHRDFLASEDILLRATEERTKGGKVCDYTRYGSVYAPRT